MVRAATHQIPRSVSNDHAAHDTRKVV
jgi:hypothetical protein